MPRIEAKPTTRVRAPYSSRMLVVTRLAMHSSASGSPIVVALPLDLLAQDGDARLEVGPADVDDDALAEARAQALVELLQLARRPVGGEHDLLAGLVERVERVEELDLRALLAGQELDVVDRSGRRCRGTVCLKPSMRPLSVTPLMKSSVNRSQVT